MMAALSNSFYEAVERRIERLTLAVAAIAAIFASVRWGWRPGAGLALGGVLSWLNFRWLEQAVGQILSAAAGDAEALSSPGRASRGIFLRIFARMVLMLTILYVILKTAWLPGKAVLAGLFSPICAAVIEVSYEILTGFQDTNLRG